MTRKVFNKKRNALMLRMRRWYTAKGTKSTQTVGQMLKNARHVSGKPDVTFCEAFHSYAEAWEKLSQLIPIMEKEGF